MLGAALLVAGEAFEAWAYRRAAARAQAEAARAAGEPAAGPRDLARAA